MVEVIKLVTVKIESDKKYFRMISLSNRYHVEDCVVIHFFYDKLLVCHLSF